jgi:MFS-type transporter involved in bile tolerance (Atg22 family)
MSKAGEELLGRIALLIFGVFILIFSLPILAIVSAVHDARQTSRVKALELKVRRLGLKV